METIVKRDRFHIFEDASKRASCGMPATCSVLSSVALVVSARYFNSCFGRAITLLAGHTSLVWHTCCSMCTRDVAHIVS